MVYTVPETKFLDCLRMIGQGDAKQQNEYSAELEAIFKEAKKAIEADGEFIISDAPDDKRIHSTVISTLEEFNELKNNYGDFLMGFEHGNSGENRPYHLGYCCGNSKRKVPRGNRR